MVPLRSVRVGSSIFGVGVGTTNFTKRLMSNATVKSIPFSINNSKGKQLKIAVAITAKVVIDQFHLYWFLRFYLFSCVNFGF